MVIPRNIIFYYCCNSAEIVITLHSTLCTKTSKDDGALTTSQNTLK